MKLESLHPRIYFSPSDLIITFPTQNIGCEIGKSASHDYHFPSPHQCFLFLEINCRPSKHPISVKTINQSYCQLLPKLFPRIIFHAPYFMGKGVLSRKEENMFLPKWAILPDQPTLLMIWMGHYLIYMAKTINNIIVAKSLR